MKDDSSYIAYTSRWWVLITIALLNSSINALWISFAPVTSKVAAFYQVGVDKVDLLISVGFFVGVFVGGVATWLVSRLGLRKTVLLASCSNFVAASLRLVTTLPGLEEQIPKEVQFWSAFVGQLFLGVANPLAFSLPSKVGHDWFPESESLIAGGIMTMSFILGPAVSSGTTPLICQSLEDVPILNMVWFVPSAITLVMALIFVRSDRPPSPPSRSAEMQSACSDDRFGQSCGGVIGTFNAIIMQLQPILCSRGYPDWFSGLAGLLVLACGIIGCVGTSIITQKNGYLEETAKITLSIGAIIGCILMQVMRLPNLEVVLGVLLAIVGFFSFGIVPLSFELNLEVTYPLEPASGISILFVTGQLLSALFIFVSGYLEKDLSSDFQDIQTCSKTGDNGEETGNITARDHTNYLLMVSGVLASQAIIFVLLFKASYKRRKANESGP